MKPAYEKGLHTIFEVGILIKLIDSIAEVAGAIFFFIAGPDVVNDLLGSLLFHRLPEISVETQTLWAWVFLSHGIVKIFLVIGLVKEKLWIFPFAGLAFAVFTAYQIHQFVYNPSFVLGLLTLFNIGFIYLISHEYRYQKKLRAGLAG